MNNVFFTIISTGKYKHSRQKTLKQTWMSGSDLLLNKNYMFASDIDDEDNVLLSGKTDHSSAEVKHLNSLTYLCKNHNQYEWYFFCDDDTFVNLKNLNYFLSDTNLLKEKNISSFGKVLSFRTDPNNPCWSYMGKDFRYYSGGAGYCISRDLLFEVEKKAKLFDETTGYCDLSMGKLMKDCQLLDVGSFHSTNPWELKHNKETIKKSITYHYMNPQMMKTCTTVCKDV